MPEKDKFDIINLLICLTVILLLFIPTLTRAWLIYDERVIFDNSFFPFPTSLSEIFETFRGFGLNFNLMSSNAIYSSNSVTRSAPLSLILHTFINFFLKKNPFSYHLFILILHIINAILVYFIIKILLGIQNNHFIKCFTLILLTLLWAIHPVILESVLLSTNVGALLSYGFFFGFLLDFLANKANKSLIRKVLIPIIFLIPMLTNEYIITLPFVLFIVSFQQLLQSENLQISLKKSFEYTFSYFIGAFLYLLYFILLSHFKTAHPLQGNEFIVFLERVFWLSPQIFFHSLKLIFYPKILSIDQSLFVKLGKSLFDPSAIFCLTFLMLWLFIPFYLFVFRKKFPDLFFLSWTFFFALLPFLHILMPSYALFAERYLYCPLTLLIFGLAKILSKNLRLTQISCLFLSVLLILCFIRSHHRTLDWKDNYSFINSTYKASKEPLFKGIGLGMLAKAITILEPAKNAEAKKYFMESLRFLEEAKIENRKLKLKFQKSLPAVVKSYGLDYDSIFTKILYLEVSSRCLELNENPEVGLQILNPIMKKMNKLDSNIFELYAYLLILEKKYTEAKNILLKANSLYPHNEPILTGLFNFTLEHENNKLEAEKYLSDLLEYYIYNPSVLTKAHDFYQSQKDFPKTARYAYLYGLRTHNKPAYQQALYLYLSINDLNKARAVIPQLLALDKSDPQSIYLINAYLQKSKDKKIN